MLKFIISIVLLISGVTQVMAETAVVTNDGTRFELAKPGEKVVVMQPGESRQTVGQKCTVVKVDWLRATHSCVSPEVVSATKEGVVKTGGEKTVVIRYRSEVLGSIAGMGLMALAMVLVRFTKIDSASNSTSSVAVFAALLLTALSTFIASFGSPVTSGNRITLAVAVMVTVTAVIFHPAMAMQRKWFYWWAIFYQGLMVWHLVLVL